MGLIITYLKGKHVEGAGIIYHTRTRGTRGLCVSQMRFSGIHCIFALPDLIANGDNSVKI